VVRKMRVLVLGVSAWLIASAPFDEVRADPDLLVADLYPAMPLR